MPRIRRSLEVFGRVQGVFFRQSTLEQARGLGVFGWVRNTPAGTVEVCVEGEEEGVRALVQWCRHGPSAAQVTQVEEHSQSYVEEYKSFRIVG